MSPSTASPKPQALLHELHCMIHLTKSGPVLTATDAALDSLREKFGREHWLLLPGFLEPKLLRTIQSLLERSDYERIERKVGTELRPLDTTADFALCVLLNGVNLFRLVERMTGCARIRRFIGRIYRRVPGLDHVHQWHDDVSDSGRLLAISINLSDRTYEGGALLLRSVETRKLLCEVHNTGFGDAIIFRIDKALQHRIAAVEGTAAKTAMAGWFKP